LKIKWLNSENRTTLLLVELWCTQYSWHL